MPVHGSGRQRDDRRLRRFLRMLVMPVNIAQVRVSTDIVQSHPVQQMKRRPRIVGDRALMDFNRNAYVQVSRRSTGAAQAISGHLEVLF